MAKRVDPQMHRDHVDPVETPLDQSGTAAELKNLPSRDHPMLPLRKLSNRECCPYPSHPTRIKSSSYFIEDLMRVGLGRHGGRPCGSRARVWRAGCDDFAF